MTKKSTPAAKRFTTASAVPFVKRFQQAMLDNGADLPKHGVDGLFGPETLEAFACFRWDINRLNTENARMGVQIAALKQERNALLEDLEDARDFIDESWNFTGLDVVLLAAGFAALGALGAACMWAAITVGAM